ncbi:hypothetical protein EYF80_047849 [Liparis tanakae]|uniref:Uncharacterized protein n=1 Tax=Liparis tanakae TaxID=230148 RepID=A0A4Z2FNT0_9TELE|nr:hypothetical protein EYF80_047849 [Liparis tanakae]
MTRSRVQSPSGTKFRVQDRVPVPWSRTGSCSQAQDRVPVPGLCSYDGPALPLGFLAALYLKLLRGFFPGMFFCRRGNRTLRTLSSVVFLTLKLLFTTPSGCVLSFFLLLRLDSGFTTPFSVSGTEGHELGDESGDELGDESGGGVLQEEVYSLRYSGTFLRAYDIIFIIIIFITSTLVFLVVLTLQRYLKPSISSILNSPVPVLSGRTNVSHEDNYKQDGSLLELPCSKREVKVDDVGDVLEVDSSGDAELFVLRPEKQNQPFTVSSVVVLVLSPGLDGQLRVEDAGGDPELLQEQFEPVAPVHRAHKDQRLALDQTQLQQRVDQQELVLLATLDAVLLQLAAVRQLRALELQDHLRGRGHGCEDGTGDHHRVHHQRRQYGVVQQQLLQGLNVLGGLNFFVYSPQQALQVVLEAEGEEQVGLVHHQHLQRRVQHQVLSGELTDLCADRSAFPVTSATRTSLEQNAVNCRIIVWTCWPSSLVGTRTRALTSCSRTL